MRRMALAALALAAAAGAAFAQETSAPAQGAAPGLPFGGLGELAQPQQTPLPPRADGKPPDLAFGAYQRGNFLYALREAERRLDDNPKDAAAMALIGSIYRDGAAVGRNDLEASRWYRLASNLGDAGAAYELGVLLLQGAPNLPKDQAAAKAQFERAAAKNHAGALYNLGVMALDSSNGHKPDFEAAAEFFKRAALAGDDNGAYSYGVMLREGKGVRRNAVEGAHWLKRASDSGVIAGQVEYAIILFNGDGIPKNEAEAVQVLRTAAIRGNPIAQKSPRASLCRGPRRSARPREGRGLERFGERRWAGGRRSRRLHDEPDRRRAEALHGDDAHAVGLLTPAGQGLRPERTSRRRNGVLSTGREVVNSTRTWRLTAWPKIRRSCR